MIDDDKCAAASAKRHRLQLVRMPGANHASELLSLATTQTPEELRVCMINIEQELHIEREINQP
jgi:hypothetical protein